MAIALRNLLNDKIRFGLSIAGVALAVMLILLLHGLHYGIFQQAIIYLDRTPGTVVVAQKGVTNFFGVSSLLPPGTASAARQVDGVARVVPVLTGVNIFELHGKKLGVQIIAYDPAQGGGPWRLAQGREPQTDREIVVDAVLARQHQLALNDTLTLLARSFTVVGLSQDTITLSASFLFVRRSAAAGLLLLPDATSFLFVTPAAGVSPELLRERLTRLPGTQVLLKGTVITNDVQLFDRIYNAPIQLMVTIAFLVGTLVVGLIIYTATVDRQREYGVLKALGAPNGVLYQVVIIQALVAAVAGTISGLALAVAAGQLIMALRPQFLITVDPPTLVSALGASLAMALLAAIFPVRAVIGLAPADVLRR